MNLVTVGSEHVNEHCFRTVTKTRNFECALRGLFSSGSSSPIDLVSFHYL